MSSAAVGTHSGAGPLSLMSCVRESSPLQDYEPPDNEKNAATKRKFWNPKKWFKRKNKASEDVITTVETSDKDVLRSRSTSELSIAEEQTRRRSGTSMHPGLSVSHDSVFHSPNSGSELELDAAQSSSSLSISQPHVDLRLQTELSERLRLRRGRGDTSEDDEGLPHSPCNSPTTADALLDKAAIKDLPTKSHSTCSDGSLLSMGSSEMDEESFSQQSRHSSKLSLQEKRSSDQDSDLELVPSGSSSAPLNHSAAHHRVSVRPKRRAPHRSKKVPQLSTALPTTPEVNEEASIRSMTPDNISRESELSTPKAPLTENQLKCSSLPPGLAAPTTAPTSLNRSRSNAGSKSQEQFVEEDVESVEKSDKSFFERIFPRRSAKKRKVKDERERPVAAPRSGAAARQRIQPIDLPPSTKLGTSPPKLGSSPLQAELENRFKQQSPIFEKTVISSIEFRKDERTKMKIPGLSSLQQRVLSLNDETDNSGFKSLTDFSDDNDIMEDDAKVAKPVTKSHSFKASKIEQKTENLLHTTNEKVAITKAASFDSIKHLEEPVCDKKESNETEPEIKNFISHDNITISGPSHTAIVNVSNNIDTYNTTNTKSETVTCGDKIKEVTTKESVSVTKIQLKRESTQITQSTVTVPKDSIPEFLNRQLNKVETRSSSNVVFSTNSPRIIDEQSRPKIVSEPKNIPTVVPRKFSQEDLEIVEKTEEISIIPMAIVGPRFKKNEPNKRKSSVTSTTPESPKREKPFLRSRSISLDSLKGENDASDKSSQDSLDKLDEKIEETPIKEKSNSAVETVVLRKKSLIKQKNDEEPELMKVFARRSLKLKDSESEHLNTMLENSKTRDSDKENQTDSPVEERKKSITENREPLVEAPKFIESAEVTLRKPNFYTRAFSVNPPKETAVETIIKKQASFSERRKTDNWITNMKNGDDSIERKISQDEIITGISPKSEFISTAELITETKNFNQRKAEWEKRAQEAQKKTVPFKRHKWIQENTNPAWMQMQKT